MSSRRRCELLSLAALALVLRLPIVFDGWFGADKIKHFVVSALLQSVTYSAAQAAGADKGDAMRLSLTTAIAAGVAREIYDARVKQRLSIPDLVWDAGGVAAATTMLRHTR